MFALYCIFQNFIYITIIREIKEFGSKRSPTIKINFLIALFLAVIWACQILI